MNAASAENRGHADLMAAVIEHLACYIQSGRPRSAHLARLLLDRLALSAGADEKLREHCWQLCEVLEDRDGFGLDHAQTAIRPAIQPAPRARPWLTWRYEGEAA